MNMMKRIRIAVVAAAVALAVAGIAGPGMYHHSHPTADPPAPLMHYHG